MAKSANKSQAGGAARLLAHLARVLREREKLTQQELGEILGYSAAAISAMETGAQPASDDMLVGLEGAIGGGLGVFEAAREMVRLDKYPAQFKDFAGLENTALTVSWWSTASSRPRTTRPRSSAGVFHPSRASGSRSWSRVEWLARRSLTGILSR